MNTTCANCGAVLSHDDAFCRNCGARRSVPASAASEALFCTNCGGPLEPGASFCIKCGARVGEPAAPPPLPIPAAPPPPAVAPHPSVAVAPASRTVAPAPISAAATPPQPKQSGNLFLKVVVAVLGLFALITVLVIGSCFYVGYRVKKKADQIQDAYKSNDVGKLAEALGGKSEGGGSGSNATAPLAFPNWQPPAGSSQLTAIPLRKNLTVVEAVNMFGKDYESVIQIKNMTDDYVHLSTNADNVPNPLASLAGPQDKQPALGSVHAERSVRRVDLQSARDYKEWFSSVGPEEFPGTTAISASTAVLNDLKTKGESSFTFMPGGLKGYLGAMAQSLGQLAGPGQKEGGDLSSVGDVKCTLKREGDSDYSVQVIVNDEPTQLPSLHATCTSADGTTDFYFLDDPSNPLTLATKFPGGGRQGSSDQDQLSP